MRSKSSTAAADIKQALHQPPCASAHSALFLYKVCTSASTVFWYFIHSTESALALHPLKIKHPVVTRSSTIVVVNPCQVGADSALAQEHLGSMSSSKSREQQQTAGVKPPEDKLSSTAQGWCVCVWTAIHQERLG